MGRHISSGRVCDGVGRRAAEQRSSEAAPASALGAVAAVSRFVPAAGPAATLSASVDERTPRLQEVLCGTADLSGVRRARGFAAEVCAEWGLDDVTPIVSLIVSELVTNVVRHAGGQFEVRLE